MNTAYQVAARRMNDAAHQRQRAYNRRAGIPPLLPGERVWVRNRKRQGQGKLASWWDPERFVVLGTVGEQGVVYRIRPERGGSERTVHRNALKICVAPEQVQAEPEPERRGEPALPMCYGFFPGGPRRSGRANFGRPPDRYTP